MKANQIATMLNTIFSEVIGESAPVAEDLSNIVDVGRTITSSTQWGDNFDKYVGKIIDKVGRTIFVDRPYEADDLGLGREAWDYGSVMEKIRVDVGDYVDNKSWQLTDSPAPSFSDLFAFDSPAEVEAKYFNMKDTFRLKICLPRNQMESAFTSAANMQRFIGAIENRIRTKREVAREALAYRTENNLIASKMQYGMNVVNLLSEYKAASGDATITAATALENADFLRYCVRRFKTDKKLLARFSGNYNVEGYGTFTPADRLKIFALTDFATAVETVLRSNTYHDAFVALDGYREVPYWQGRGLGASFADRSTIYAYPALREATSVLQNQSGIVFVMQDYDAAMIANEDIPVDSIYNPEGRFYKYWYGCDCSYYNDLAENVIVYVIADDNDFNIGLKMSFAKGATNGTTIATVTAPTSIDTTNAITYKYAVAPDKMPRVSDATPTTGYTSLTSGTTEISVTAGQQIVIVAIQNGKIITVGTHTAASSEIK
jgi:hypothetical protein